MFFNPPEFIHPEGFFFFCTEAVVGDESGCWGVGIRPEFDPQSIGGRDVAGQAARAAEVAQQFTSAVVDAHFQVVAIAEFRLLQVKLPEGYHHLVAGRGGNGPDALGGQRIRIGESGGAERSVLGREITSAG